ncbi:Asx homology domain-domain-containing protein [Coniella lustricola]|uniref:Asx homology domain-domain-containing protein n=1 Tax=Coniella lustricola TaxID=2025994 RepID=A0A2T3AJZ6_9PEZI|nr:Asx homology domain-domain-containing protein [Coniella lustricola]
MQQPLGKKRPVRRTSAPTATHAGPGEDSDEPAPPPKRRAVLKKSQASTPAKINNGRSRSTKKVKVANRQSTKWTPDNVTSSTKSPLININLRTLLLQPAAWDCLTDEDRAEILAQFPDDTHILDAGTPNARPNMESLRNDDSFRHDAEEYTSNLSKGMHDPVWLKDAWNAHYRRAAGEFDAYYVRKLEVDWETTIPNEFKPAELRSDAKVENLVDVPNGQVYARHSRKNSSTEKQEASQNGHGPSYLAKVDDLVDQANGDAVAAKADGPRFEVIPDEDHINARGNVPEIVHKDGSRTSMKFINSPELQEPNMDMNDEKAAVLADKERAKSSALQASNNDGAVEIRRIQSAGAG